MSLVSTVEVGVQDASKALDTLETEYQTEKTKIVNTLQAHITAHQKQAAAHNAEIAATQQVLAKALPTATAAQTEAASFVLTSHSTWVVGVINFFGKNWRYVALGLIVVGVVAALHNGLVKLP